ncbi:MAG: hypothetical protein A2498_11880 [Lentisphaerae bacterium RIFOXYC12_FULL_60_16]|nr:MAG: hypothetical protein A2498_11880 [Lentisphaerae bacterium RIFOXYC12_FULL_60_16]OGV72580.1 MAG: hypothetical protein A2269_01125 [Lentisphaerae bacterium RIFOXYA12_FULL_60_10]OGV77298.1 MAG: hypothetical protein A2340_06225 [Lentisphaerae bacterium RIFOXYB12_FULL_60_10]
MTREIMHRNASDNHYLHKDFHGGLSCGIEYLDIHFGTSVLHNYLRTFCRTFFAPLHAAVVTHGLSAIRKHYERVFEEEAGIIDVDASDDHLTITVRACPAILHMQKRGLPIAKRFCDSTRIMNECLCEGTPFTSELCDCNPRTGTCVQRFRRLS